MIEEFVIIENRNTIQQVTCYKNRGTLWLI